MTNINQIEGYATMLMNEMDKLEDSNYKNIGQFMVHEHGIDWELNPNNKQIAYDLAGTMQLNTYKHDNGYTVYEWMPL